LDHKSLRLGSGARPQPEDENAAKIIFAAACRIPARSFVVVVKAKHQASLETTTTGADMPLYLVAVQHPNNYDPSLEGEAMIRDINALNEEMDAAGARSFAGGLESPSLAKALRKKSDGAVSITDGPFLEAKEYIGGFWILECADMDEALAWGRKAVVACRVPVEVRAFLRFRPDKEVLTPGESS
jgi:hypothetical protein